MRINNNENYRELVVSYKVVCINTFNVMVLDLSPGLDQMIVYRHRSNHF